MKGGGKSPSKHWRLAGLAALALIGGLIGRCSAEPAPDSHTHSLKNGTVTITIPATWTFVEEEDADAAMHRTDNDRVKGYFVIETLTKPIALRDLVEAARAQLQKDLPDSDIGAAGETTMGSLPGYSFVVHNTKTQNSIQYLVTLKGMVAYTLLLAAPDDQVSPAAADFQLIKESLAL